MERFVFAYYLGNRIFCFSRSGFKCPNGRYNTWYYINGIDSIWLRRDYVRGTMYRENGGWGTRPDPKSNSETIATIDKNKLWQFLLEKK